MVPADLKLNEVDVKILKALLKDARTKFSDISRESGVSIPMIHKRFNDLKKSGIISGTCIISDLTHKFKFALAVELNVEAGKEQTILKQLKELPNLRNASMVVGKYDIHAVYHIETFEEIEKIREKLSKKDGIKNIKFIASNQIFGLFPLNLDLRPVDGQHG